MFNLSGLYGLMSIKNALLFFSGLVETLNKLIKIFIVLGVFIIKLLIFFVKLIQFSIQFFLG